MHLAGSAPLGGGRLGGTVPGAGTRSRCRRRGAAAIQGERCGSEWPPFFDRICSPSWGSFSIVECYSFFSFPAERRKGGRIVPRSTDAGCPVPTNQLHMPSETTAMRLLCRLRPAATLRPATSNCGGPTALLALLPFGSQTQLTLKKAVLQHQALGSAVCSGAEDWARFVERAAKSVAHPKFFFCAARGYFTVHVLRMRSCNEP